MFSNHRHASSKEYVLVLRVPYIVSNLSIKFSKEHATSARYHNLKNTNSMSLKSFLPIDKLRVKNMSLYCVSYVLCTICPILYRTQKRYQNLNSINSISLKSFLPIEKLPVKNMYFNQVSDILCLIFIQISIQSLIESLHFFIHS